MNREFLKGLGLEDDAIDKVMAEHGKTVNATKGELDSIKTERDDLKTQLTDRDTQLQTLSEQVKDNEELTKEIEKMKSGNEEKVNELQQKLDQQAFDFSLENALKDAKVRNPKAVKALLDAEKIKLDGETLLGLDDQLTTLKESDAYLFETEENPESTPQIVTPGNPDGGTNPDGDPFDAILAKYE